MVFPVIGGDGKPTGYEVSNSLRWNDGDSPEFQFTPSSTGNQKTWTVSFWVKRANITTTSSQFIFATDTGHDEHVWCRFCGTEVSGKEDMFQVYMGEPNGRETNVRTNRLFRDVSAWYHIVVRCDTTQSTAADRLRIYVNGVKETSFQQASYVNQNDDNMNWNDTVEHAIGHQVQSGSTERHLDAYLSEMYSIDGTSLGPDSFGETNDNGVWVPIEYSGSFGTNGWYLEFKQTGTSANSSGMGADTSGNDHHWTPGNLAATDVTVDTPTNNFATLNPLINSNGTYTLSEGNTKFVADGSNGWNTTTATMGFSKGKWYWEQKFTQVTGGASFAGLVKDDVNHADNDISGQDDSEGVLYYANAGNYMFGASGTYVSAGVSFGASFDDGDIISVAADLDNNKMYFAKNGTYQGSGDPANGSNGLPISEGAQGLVAGSFSFVFPYAGAFYANDGCEWNFGNPAFAISSGNADANGYGNFEYAVPSGFYSICTKNLAEYG